MTIQEMDETIDHWLYEQQETEAEINDLLKQFVITASAIQGMQKIEIKKLKEENKQ